ncbi:MAG: hypothetical protein IH586_02310 [Anaerolineaceae bacterium]|nr:hypothetical protein [Anaerolineaceae bacterium]
MHWLAVLVLILQNFFPLLSSSPAQDNGSAGATVVDTGSTTEFGKKIVFAAQAQPAADVSEMLVSFTPEGQITHLEQMNLGAAGNAIYEIPVVQLPLAPFTQITYSFEARWKDGTKASSQKYTLAYNDNRYVWQYLEEGIFQVHWNAEDATLGQDLINVASAGLEEAQRILPINPPAPLRIYAYSSARALQEALLMTNDIWVAGHASPDLGLILISVPTGPEKKLELQRQIPHEIMHLLQYQIVGKNLSRQPVWLMEGMSSLVELYPNPEYGRVLEETAKNDELIPMENLCDAFPNDAGPAFKAYAQSESFVRFLHTTYGTTGLRSLMDQSQNGLGCNEAVSAAFGTTLGQLEYRWKQEVLGINAGELAVRRLSPYLWLALLLLVPAVFSFWPMRKSKESVPENPAQEKL